MKVGLLQYDVLRDREANLQKAEAFLEKNQCELLLLPELAMGGYLFESRKALLAASEPVPGGALPGGFVCQAWIPGQGLWQGHFEKAGCHRPGAAMRTAGMVVPGLEPAQH